MSKKAFLKDKWFWFMLIVEMVMIFFFGITLSMTAPLITNIVDQTGWSLAEAGQLNTYMYMTVGIFCFLGSPIMDRLGTKKTALLALIIGAAGCLLALPAGTNHTMHLIAKLLYGVGWGLYFIVPGTVIGYWVPTESAALFQGIRSAMDLFSFGVSFYVILPVFNMLDQNWQMTFFVFGIITVVVFFLYLFFVRTNEEEKADQERLRQARKEREAAKAAGVATAPGIVQALKSKYVWLMIVTMIGKIWTYTVFMTYLPAYYELERGMTAEAAAAYTGLASVGGMIAGVVVGALSTALGRRVVTTWPMMIILSVGALGSLFVPEGFLMSICVALIGFGTTGYMVAYTTIPAELPGANPQFYTGAVGACYGSSCIASFFLTYPFDAMLNAGMTIQTALLVNIIPAAVGIVIMFFLPETGPKGKMYKQLQAERESSGAEPIRIGH